MTKRRSNKPGHRIDAVVIDDVIREKDVVNQTTTISAVTRIIRNGMIQEFSEDAVDFMELSFFGPDYSEDPGEQ